ncbi:hypothetical protein [Oculatella sp. LEGE 06141]|nr:hypothetical protein [Oculatella sp. LEGE 06141]
MAKSTSEDFRWPMTGTTARSLDTGTTALGLQHYVNRVFQL